MDSHDAILEQLRRAQNRGLEAVTNRLDFVVESLDELIAEAKNAVREAIPSEAEQILPLDEVSREIGALARRASVAEVRVAELEARLVELEAVARPAAPSGFDRQALRTLDAARSQSDLLRELLPRLADHVARAVVLVVRGGRISAWSGIGFADGERLRAWNADVAASPTLARFADEALPFRFDPAGDPVLAEWLAGEPRAMEALLIPVCLRGKMMGGLYVDRLPERPWDPDGAQSMIALTCWMIDTLHHRQVVPAPMLADIVDLRETGESTEDLVIAPAAEPGYDLATEAEPEAAAPEAADEHEPAPPVGYRPEPEQEYEPEYQAEPEQEYEPEYRPEPRSETEMTPEAAPESHWEAGETEPEFDPSATMRVEVGDMVTTTPMPVIRPLPEYEPETEPEPAPAAPSPVVVGPAAMPEPPPVAPVTPPAARPPVATLGVAPEDEARHEEARRFARLLVSEIKLYNEDEVERGRVNRDLYKRLKEDIDRSREMYEKRIPPEIRDLRDYFHSELVRILADGNEDALGM